MSMPMPKDPPSIFRLLLEAVDQKDRATIQRVSLSPNPQVRAAAYVAADCVSLGPGAFLGFENE